MKCTGCNSEYAQVKTVEREVEYTYTNHGKTITKSFSADLCIDCLQKLATELAMKIDMTIAVGMIHKYNGRIT